ncbi:meckelin [Arctopsyche grandis]|uniref:meckelin n=1 Tax=Arctopsyche grandis TaxID=121162 RepID=UPI00406D6882
MYGEDESYVVLYRKKIDIAYSLNENSQYNYLNIIAMKTDPLGNVRGYSDLYSQWMLPCPTIRKASGSNLLKFSVDYRHRCTVGAKQLYSESETVIFEPFIKYIDDDSKDSTPVLHTVPTLVKGNLVHFNKDSDVNTWQLIKRFYLFDKTSGISNVNGVQVIKYFRYAKYIEIRIRIRRKGKGERSKIYPPLFIVHYAELSEDDVNVDVNVNMEFAITYELDGASMVNGMEIAVGSISAFGILYTILQTWSYSRRLGILGFDAFTILQFFIFACGNLANSFFIVSFGASSYSFIINKMQKVVYMLPPTKKDEYVIQTYIIVAFSLKIFEVLAINWKQINVDISFIDWEKPNQPLLEIGIKTPSKTNLKAEAPKSFWRPYFVANEWNEIQTMRKISLPLHLVACIFALEVFGASSWTRVGVQVDSNRSTEFITSPAYQLAASGLIFLSLYSIQLMLSLFLYERYIKNAILDFMDVCSIANVSLLILDAPLHGYYLHGRSIHATCETDARGLQPGLPYRAFSIRCTPDFRLYFSRLSTHMVINGVKWQWQHHMSTADDRPNLDSSATAGLNSARKSSGRSSRREDSDMAGNGLPSVINHREQAAKLINKFLTAFLDHALEDLDYEVREKHFLERIFDIELMDEGNYKTLFLYNTSGDSQSFQRTIWYGQEWTLVTFDLYLFCLVQITTGSYVVAALVTAVVWKFLEMCRQYAGKKNLAKKTLVDERFLI